jgi:hypothetical protein
MNELTAEVLACLKRLGELWPHFNLEALRSIHPISPCLDSLVDGLLEVCPIDGEEHIAKPLPV